MVNDEQDTVAIGYPEIKDLIAERRMPPIGTEQRELGAGDLLDVRWKGFELAFEPNGPPEDHRSLTMSSIESYCWGSMASSLCPLLAARSLGVGFRPGTLAANSTGSKGTSAFAFFVLAFTME